MRHQIRPRVVFFNGPPRAGKDTAARIMDNYKRATVLPLARALKETTHRFFKIQASYNAFEATKDERLDFFNGLTPREAYIWMSEVVVKPKFGDDYWAYKWIEAYEQAMKHRIIPCAVPDAGFQKEINVIAAYVGPQNCMLVRLSSPGKTFANDSRGYVQPLEGMHCAVITNNYTAQFEAEVVDAIKVFL